jgi:hypothetical protein
MTEPTRGVRPRRNTRRPGWVLLTALLVLAIIASSALVFTNKVELLKLAVIIALWAAVVAAFISFIYRRQADVDQAKARDLKLVYDLQLDREISARREYELSVEAQLRRELASELRAQSSDEVASLRAELAALRANLEILFDTDLAHRPALETERTAVHTFGRVISSRIDAEDRDDEEPHTDESPIIDVPAEPHPPEHEWSPSRDEGGAHRRASDRAQAQSGWRPAEPPPPMPRAPEQPREAEVRFPWLPPEPPPAPTPSPAPAASTPRSEPAPAPRSEPAPAPRPEPVPKPEPLTPPPTPAPAAATPPPAAPVSTPPAATPPAASWPEPQRPGRHGSDTGWQPVSAEGQFIPAGQPGSNWQPAVENGTSAPSVPPAPPSVPPARPEPVPPAAVTPPIDPTPTPAPHSPPAMTPPSTGGRRRKPEPVEANGDDAPRRARHSSGGVDPGRPSPTLATPSSTPPSPPAPVEETPAAQHRGADEAPVVDDDGQHAGGQPLSELFARLQVAQSEGGGRRRRED